jgi:hypothetical protein
VAHGRPHARVAIRLETSDARAHRSAGGIGEALERKQLHAS